jgi:pyrroloquinoline quinone (PQQ) biosynthesis protein C
MGFPRLISLCQGTAGVSLDHFMLEWRDIMESECHRHSIWQGAFMKNLRDVDAQNDLGFGLASVWAVNMVHGSYCFPRYVAALASRAQSDFVRHGLIENAWDESGGIHHYSRSHFWLAVRLARLLGLRDEEIERVRPLPSAIEYMDAHFNQCSNGEFDVGLGMICLIEEFTTSEFSAVFKGLLRTCYASLGLSQDEFILNGGGEYFTANISDDETHREKMPLIVAVHLAEAGVNLESVAEVRKALSGVIQGIQESIHLRANFLEGIVEYVRGGRSYLDLVNQN